MVKKDKLNKNDEIAKIEMQKIHKHFLEGLENYRKTLSYMYGDAPIGVLCLDKSLERVLINADILRVYDLFNRDLTEIKGIGEARFRNLTTSLDKFLSVC